MFERILRKPKKEPPRVEKILPEDVRYTLRYGKGLLGKNEIEVLARNNFLNEAMYLTFKSLVDNPEQHKALLEKYISCILNDNNLINKKEVLKELVTNELGDKKDLAVKGNKLAQLSRQGFDYWQERFKSSAKELSNDERNVYMLAHSTFVGLDSFIKSFSEKDKTLNILVPEWTQTDRFGYVINFKDKKANLDWLKDPLDDKNGAILFDDTINTENTIESSREFLIKHGSKNPELKAIDNVNKQ